MTKATRAAVFGLAITGPVMAQSLSPPIDILCLHPTGKAAFRSTQFCRQCHSDKTNRSNHTQGLTKQFQ